MMYLCLVTKEQSVAIGVVHYGPTFHGDLNGTARFAARLRMAGGGLKIFNSNNQLSESSWWG